MANIKSAKKDILRSQRNHTRNSHYKSRMRTAIVKAQAAIAAKAENQIEVLREALKIIDKTAGKGVISRETAARKKSRLSLSANRTNSTASEVEKTTPKARVKKAAAPKAKRAVTAKKPVKKESARKAK